VSMPSRNFRLGLNSRARFSSIPDQPTFANRPEPTHRPLQATVLCRLASISFRNRSNRQVDYPLHLTPAVLVPIISLKTNLWFALAILS
jgi:hypothetical protein